MLNRSSYKYNFVQYAQYQRFATEEFVLQAGGVLCPQPGCGMGILIDGGCTKVACVNGCGVRLHHLCVWSRINKCIF